MFSPIALFLFPLRLIARPGVDVRSAHAETELRHNFSLYVNAAASNPCFPVLWPLAVKGTVICGNGE